MPEAAAPAAPVEGAKKDVEKPKPVWHPVMDSTNKMIYGKFDWLF